MSGRDQVLAAVRAALAGADRAVPPAPRDYRAVSTADALGLFVERVQDYRATVVRCTAGEVEAAIADALAGRSAVVPSGLPWSVPGAVEDYGQPATELDRVDAVVTGAAVGIAITGTIVLDHGLGQGRRALSLVPDLHTPGRHPPEPRPAADLDQRPLGHQRHRARPGRGRPRTAAAARHPARHRARRRLMPEVATVSISSIIVIGVTFR